MKSRPAAVVFIFITVMLDMLALGLIAPVLPKLILNFLSGNTTSAANWLGIFGTVFALMQFFFSPVLGVLSDKFGRRPVILLSNLGLGLDYIVMALSPTIGWLFLGRIISGITASSIPTAMAYIADVTPKEKRAGAFGMIGASLAIVGIFTAAISGGLTGRIVGWLGERRTLYIGQFFGAVGMLIAGLARTSAVYIASIPIISMWNISFPAAQGMMTHRVSEREQGELQGAIQSLRSIAFVIGPFLFSGIFAWFINPKHSFHIPGAPYYLAAVLLFTAMLLATRVEQPQFGQPSEKPVEPSEAVPPGGIASGAVAPIADPAEENV